ncbi:MAG: hypothetical protein KDB00_15040 [Planctomycetales bacterium]|nr:hypothetical protein [Planctomycetales bacterium]
MNANELQAIVGDANYNQLVDSLDDTIQKGRFRFWQDDLFASVADRTGGKITFDQFLKIMTGATHAIRDISAEEFLSDPIAFWKDKTVRFDPELIRDAWDSSPAFSAAICDECLCSVALTDSLQHVSRDSELIAENLSPEICAQIYQHVARWVCMPESEWRDNFLRVFPSIENLVPYESQEDGLSLVTRLRAELLKALGDNSPVRQDWLVTPRLVTAGARDCWLVLETGNALGLLYAPYGALEPEYKWGVADDVALDSAEDQTWVTSFAEGVEVLVENDADTE